MTPKEYLNQYGAIERNIRLMEEEKERCRRRALRITPSYQPVIGKTGISDPVARAVEQMEKWEKKIVAEIDRLYDLRQEIESVIGAVPDPVQREVLRRRYISLQSLEKIAVEMSYSYRQIIRLHGWGLQQVAVPDRMAHHVT